MACEDQESPLLFLESIVRLPGHEKLFCPFASSMTVAQALFREVASGLEAYDKA